MTNVSTMHPLNKSPVEKRIKVLTILNYLTVTGELAEPDVKPISIAAVWSSLTSTIRLLNAIKASKKTNYTLHCIVYQ